MLQLQLNTYLGKREDNIFPFFDVNNYSLRAIKALKQTKHTLHRFSTTFITILILIFSNHCFATNYTITGDIAGEITHHTITEDDTLYSIARTYDVGIVELMAANPKMDPWIPPVGMLLTVPTSYILPKVKPGGIVINLSELRLFYFPDAKTVMTFPVGIGREGWQTPIGDTTIILKRKDPSWIPPASIVAIKPDLPKIIPAGPDNPLGKYALSLGWESFAIHGTNKPHGIGLRSSHGCIRMYPEDIEVLFNAVKKGTKVTVIDNAYKLGWINNILYLEVTPTQQQTDSIINYKDPEILIPSEIYTDIDKIIGNTKIELDWLAVDNAIIRRDGIPIVIGNK